MNWSRNATTKQKDLGSGQQLKLFSMQLQNCSPAKERRAILMTNTRHYRDMKLEVFKEPFIKDTENETTILNDL